MAKFKRVSKDYYRVKLPSGGTMIAMRRTSRDGDFWFAGVKKTPIGQYRYGRKTFPTLQRLTEFVADRMTGVSAGVNS